jgi:hypothetical protein
LGLIVPEPRLNNVPVGEFQGFNYRKLGHG